MFIERVLQPLVDRLPTLRVIFEHITTMQAVSFVESAGPKYRGDDHATAPAHQPQRHPRRRHPPAYVLPAGGQARTAPARAARAATSGSAKYFLGTDSAPHHRHDKESDCGCAGIFNAPFALESYVQVFEDEGALDRFEAFASLNGPRILRARPKRRTGLRWKRRQSTFRQEVDGGEARIVPFHAGETLSWRLAS